MRRPAAIFFAALLAYALTAGGHLYSDDEEVLFRTTRAIATEGTTAIAPVAGGFATRAPIPSRADGREYPQYGIGQPLAAAPLVWLGNALAGKTDDAAWRNAYGIGHTDAAALRFAPIAAEIAPRFVISWFNNFIAAGLAALVYFICLEIFGNATASSWAATLYAFGTLAWPHSRPFFTETFAAFCIALAWWAALRSRRGLIYAWLVLAGSAAGYAALVRMDSVLAYPGLALILLGPVAQAARERKLSVGMAWGAFAAPAALCGVILLAINYHSFGGILKTGYADQPEGVAFQTPLLAGLFGFLFSAGKGLFFFSPPLALGLWGWGAMRRGENRIAWPVVAGLALAAIVPLLIQSTWRNWPGGWCWGPRHIFLIHPFLAIPVAAWLARDWNPAKRGVALVFLIVGAAVQLLGASQDFIGFHQRFFRSPGDNSAFLIRYDEFDEQYWGQYFRVQYADPTNGQIRTLPALVLPPPIQDSVYHPQRSVWAGYPQMLREGSFDNLWLRLMRQESTPLAAPMTAPAPAAFAPKPEARP